jgi:hypothetical protein
MSLAGETSGQLAAVVRTADRVDFRDQSSRPRNRSSPFKPVACTGSPSSIEGSGASQSKVIPANGRSVWLSIGNCLRAQYDALTPPMPPHIAALVEQLETGNRSGATMYVQGPHWLDYDPVALAVLVIGIGIIELLALIII